MAEMHQHRHGQHHPQGDVLLAYAAGTLDEASSVLVATHLALCPHCRADVARLEAVGGEILETVDIAPMSAGALDNVLARLDMPVAPQPAKSNARDRAPSALPRPLRDYVQANDNDIQWKKLTSGVEYLDLNIRANGRRARLLKILPGTRVPRHGHGGEEMTMVLAGGYTDEFGSYGRGDVETADSSHVHQPIADAGEPCICLTVTRGALLPSAVVSVLSKIFPRFGA